MPENYLAGDNKAVADNVGSGMGPTAILETSKFGTPVLLSTGNNWDALIFICFTKFLFHKIYILHFCPHMGHEGS